MKPGKVLLILVFPFFAASIGATGFSLDGLDLDTTGYIPDGNDTPRFESSGFASVRFIPASWINLKTGASFNISNTGAFFNPVPESRESGLLTFDNASVLFYPPTGDGLCISVFTGTYDDPSSDSLLREFQKTKLDTPEFQDMPAGMAFSPEMEINGTGMSLSTVPGNRNTVLGFYGYWNSKVYSESTFSGDVRFCGTGNIGRFNAFIGGSDQPTAASSLSVRGGISVVFNTESGNELYTAVGIRNMKTANSRIDRNLYLIFEPRIYFEKADFAFSFFSSPLFLENAPSYESVDSESNYLGVNVLAAFGNIDIQRMRGGLSVLASINPQKPETHTPFAFSVSPFYSMMVSDYQINVTAVITPLTLYDPQSAIKLRLSLKAVY